jgi:ABC-type lipoprotein release transport system permease subunit
MATTVFFIIVMLSCLGGPIGLAYGCILGVIVSSQVEKFEKWYKKECKK